MSSGGPPNRMNEKNPTRIRDVIGAGDENFSRSRLFQNPPYQEIFLKFVDDETIFRAVQTRQQDNQ